MEKKIHLIRVHVNLKPLQSSNDHFQLNLVSFAWIFLFLDDITATPKKKENVMLNLKPMS